MKYKILVTSQIIICIYKLLINDEIDNNELHILIIKNDKKTILINIRL